MRLLVSYSGVGKEANTNCFTGSLWAELKSRQMRGGAANSSSSSV